MRTMFGDFGIGMCGKDKLRCMNKFGRFVRLSLTILSFPPSLLGKCQILIRFHKLVIAWIICSGVAYEGRTKYVSGVAIFPRMPPEIRQRFRGGDASQRSVWTRILPAVMTLVRPSLCVVICVGQWHVEKHTHSVGSEGWWRRASKNSCTGDNAVTGWHCPFLRAG